MKRKKYSDNNKMIKYFTLSYYEQALATPTFFLVSDSAKMITPTFNNLKELYKYATQKDEGQIKIEESVPDEIYERFKRSMGYGNVDVIFRLSDLEKILLEKHKEVTRT